MNTVGEFPKTKLEVAEYPTMEVKWRRQFPEEIYWPFLEKGSEEPSASETSILTRRSLMKKRDSMSLFMSEPSKIPDDWVSYSLEEPYDESSLIYFEGLMPTEMIRDTERSCSCSTFHDARLVPEAVLNLVADLAVHHLIQTLISISKHQHLHHIKYITLSTRSDFEKRLVASKTEAALKDKHCLLDILYSFHGTLSIDTRTYSTRGVEDQFRQHVCQLLGLPMMEDDIVRTKLIEEKMAIKRYIVLLVGRDGDEEIIDPRKVGFSKTELSGVLVLITTESATDQAMDKRFTGSVDLEIRTKDHLLPWQLLCHSVGSDVVYSSSATMMTVVRIVEESRGHLLAIVLLARWLLRNPHYANRWELALHKMRCTNPFYGIHSRLSRVIVNAFINFVWDGMNKTLKLCLVRCLSLYIPDVEDVKDDYELMNDWISSLFIDAEEARNNLSQLVECCALQAVKTLGDGIKRYIRLPEEIYEIVDKLHNLDPMLIKKAGEVVEAATIERWHSAVQIELVDTKLFELPLSPNWPDLTVLVLQANADLTEIPPSYFDYTPLLRILDLSYTSLRELPSSFFNLEQLRELYMKGCQCFMKLPPEIGKLKKLEKLDLEETQITHLPEEFQQLTNMQSLILYFYEYHGKKNKPYSVSTIIPSGVISKLKGLKHLSIDVNPDDERWHENVRVILPEILELELLQTLSIYIPHLELLKLIPAKIFEVDFRFIVGCHKQRIISSIPPAVDAKFKRSDRSLKFVRGVDVPAEIKMLLGHSKALFLDRHFTIKNLSEFGMKNLEQLRVCILAECKEMETVVGGRHSNGNDDMLSHLLFFSVSHMKNLRNIWEGPNPPRWLFGMLQSLWLQSCPKLITLFSLDFLGNLSLLKELTVKDCPKLSTLISRESSKSYMGKNIDAFLPKLRKLLLLHLPELTSISSGLSIGPGLKEIAFYDCPKLHGLSRKELVSKELMTIKGETNWWKSLQGQPSEFHQIFSPIHEEADVMTQLGINNGGDFDNGPGKLNETSLADEGYESSRDNSHNIDSPPIYFGASKQSDFELSINDGIDGGSSFEKERIRRSQVQTEKNFTLVERVNGRDINVLQGLELHKRVFNSMEQSKIVECIYRLQWMGKQGKLTGRTYSEPRKWMRGKGRVTIQFGCCYNYVVDKYGNPPGIVRDEEVEPLPPLFKQMIKRMVRWNIVPPTGIPNSCIVNIYDEGDNIPPHIDHHDFVRPFYTVSFLSECKILFGSNLQVVHPREFAIPLPMGSVFVFNGNGADVAKHCISSVRSKRISITFRKMAEKKLPYKFSPDPELVGVKPLSTLKIPVVMRGTKLEIRTQKAQKSTIISRPTGGIRPKISIMPVLQNGQQKRQYNDQTMPKYQAQHNKIS